MRDRPESARNAPFYAVKRVCQGRDPIMDLHDKEAFVQLRYRRRFGDSGRDLRRGAQRHQP